MAGRTRTTALAALAAALACAAVLAFWARPALAGLSHFSHDVPAQADDSRLQAAAEDGSTEAQYLMGSMCMLRAEEQELKGWHSRAVMLYKQAGNWFHQAAGAGHSRARFSLGLMHLRGLGVSRDLAKGLRWLEAAARDGDPDANYVLGSMLANGDGLRRDGRKALERFAAAGQGFLDQGRADWLVETAQAVRALSPGDPLADDMEAAARSLASAPADRARGTSTGTAWIAAPGFAVTNYHVVAGHGDISLVHPDGNYVSATVAARDQDNDLALLAVEDRCSLPPALPLAQGAPGLGAQVFTVGFPEPGIMGASPKLATGRVTGAGDAAAPAFQISVPLAHGNSGGPLVNLRGEVVGVIQAMIDAARVFRQTGQLHQNVNYAIRPELVSALIARAPAPDRGVLDRLKGLFAEDCPATVQPADGSVEDHAPVVQQSVLMVVAR